MDDEKIVSMYLRREEEALIRTREKYEALCRSVAQKILPDGRDVEECVSDVWLKLWNSIPPARPESLKGYAARTARNLALDRYDYNTAAQRNSALTESFEELETALPEAAADGSGMEGAFASFLNEFLGGLNREARVYFVRRYWYGESIKEIAASCRVSESKVKTSLMRTRTRMRNAMKQEGVNV